MVDYFVNSVIWCLCVINMLIANQTILVNSQQTHFIILIWLYFEWRPLSKYMRRKLGKFSYKIQSQIPMDIEIIMKSVFSKIYNSEPFIIISYPKHISHILYLFISFEMFCCCCWYFLLFIFFILFFFSLINVYLLDELLWLFRELAAE